MTKKNILKALHKLSDSYENVAPYADWPHEVFVKFKANFQNCIRLVAYVLIIITVVMFEYLPIKQNDGKWGNVDLNFLGYTIFIYFFSYKNGCIGGSAIVIVAPPQLLEPFLVANES